MRNPHHTNFALVATLASWASNLLLSLPDLESQQRLISRIFARLRAPWHPLCRMCRSPRYAQRGSLLDTHTNQQVRAPLSLPSRASCASSAIATANSPSHRATSESTVGVRYLCFCGTAVPPLPPPAPSSARAASAGAPGNAFAAPPLPLFLCCCSSPNQGEPELVLSPHDLRVATASFHFSRRGVEVVAAPTTLRPRRRRARVPRDHRRDHGKPCRAAVMPSWSSHFSELRPT